MGPTAKKVDRGHGSPFDRGGSDYYYGRPYTPHKMIGTDAEKHLLKNRETALTADELTEYDKGYNRMDERKDWG